MLLHYDEVAAFLFREWPGTCVAINNNLLFCTTRILSRDNRMFHDYMHNSKHENSYKDRRTLVSARNVVPCSNGDIPAHATDHFLHIVSMRFFTACLLKTTPLVVHTYIGYGRLQTAVYASISCSL